jgi:hypothetical protein
LEDENSYIALEHECLRPSEDLIVQLGSTKRDKSGTYEMIEVVDASYDLSLE